MCVIGIHVECGRRRWGPFSIAATESRATGSVDVGETTTRLSGTHGTLLTGTEEVVMLAPGERPDGRSDRSYSLPLSRCRARSHGERRAAHGPGRARLQDERREERRRAARS